MQSSIERTIPFCTAAISAASAVQIVNPNTMIVKNNFDFLMKFNGENPQNRCSIYINDFIIGFVHFNHLCILNYSKKKLITFFNSPKIALKHY